MEYLKKSEVIELIQKFIDARKGKNCSKTTIIERVAFEYALAVVNKAKTYNFDERN